VISAKARSILVAFGILLTGVVTGQPEKRTIDLILQKSYYTPVQIEVTKGETVRLSLRSMDVTHGFAIDELNIAREISPGPPTIINLPTSKAGTFPFYCVVRCGKDHLKMRGTLVVTE
jgi:cytochrome c oxidase subunit II